MQIKTFNILNNQVNAVQLISFSQGVCSAIVCLAEMYGKNDINKFDLVRFGANC